MTTAARCGNCGASLRPETKACEYCGAAVPPPPAATGAAGIFADRDGDGVPDIFEGAGTRGSTTHSVTTSYSYNGVEYASLDEMPPDVRRAFESATAGIPDLVRDATQRRDVSERTITWETEESSGSGLVRPKRREVRTHVGGKHWLAYALYVVLGLLAVLACWGVVQGGKLP